MLEILPKIMPTYLVFYQAQWLGYQNTTIRISHIVGFTLYVRSSNFRSGCQCFTELLLVRNAARTSHDNERIFKQVKQHNIISLRLHVVERPRLLCSSYRTVLNCVVKPRTKVITLAETQVSFTTL